jgi:hypothetical protein
MYDSFLFGYGLTLAISQKLSNSPLLSPQQKEILYLNTFLRAFVKARKSERMYRQFLALFRIDSNIAKLHEVMKNKLELHIEEIIRYGFERWVSKNLFGAGNQVSDEEKMYIYLLHSYWAHLIYTEILSLPKVKKILISTANEIQKKFHTNKNIFTTNFDTILDNYLKPKHLHGSISLPLVNVGDLILNIFPNEKDFEYSYLFGTNGLEKMMRLDKIRQLAQNKYHLEFFFDHKINLGHLLIYGLSFGNAEAISNEFLEKFPKHENFYLTRSVDGHILLKLNERYQKGHLSKITISYYTSQDLEHLRYFFSMTNLMPIIEFRHSNDIFQI